jgi:hypothetical protein
MDELQQHSVKYLKVIQADALFIKMLISESPALVLNPIYRSSLKSPPASLITSRDQAIPSGLSALAILKNLLKVFGRTPLQDMSS